MFYFMWHKQAASANPLKKYEKALRYNKNASNIMKLGKKV